jgi:hypothetical protein
MPAHRTWTDEQLIIAVQTSRSVAEVCRRLGLRGGSAYEGLARHIDRLDIDASHFSGQGWARGHHKSPDEIRAYLVSILRKGVEVAKLRDRLIATGLKEARCEECGISEWMGQPAPLQVDHTDGDRLNNELDNLRVLCANCHALTETWGFKNARRRPRQALVA